jgi:hypothetical protein
MLRKLSQILLTVIIIFNIYGLSKESQKEYKEENYVDTLTKQGDNFLGLDELLKADRLPFRLTAPKEYSDLKTACKNLEGQFIVNIQDFYFVKKCQLRTLRDSSLVNKIVMAKTQSYQTVGKKTLALFSLGEDFSYNDYLEYKKEPKAKVLKRICKKYENSVVTQNGNQFFLVKACIKHPFSSYIEVENFRKNKILTYRSINANQLDMLPLGQKITVNKDDDSSPFEKRIDVISYKNACKKLNKTLVAFHSKVFFLKNCTISQVLNFPVLEQMKYAQRHSVIPIETRDFLELKLESPISLDKLKEYLNERNF